MRRSEAVGEVDQHYAENQREFYAQKSRGALVRLRTFVTGKSRHVIPVRFGIALFIAGGFGAAVPGGAQCAAKAGQQRVVKKDLMELQRWVNDGHEPWRTDASAVAAETLFRIQNAPTDQWDVYRLKLKRVQETQRRAVYEYNAGQNLCYRTTLQRFSWLLPLGKKWKWVIWAPTDVKCEKCRSTAEDIRAKSNQGKKSSGS